MSPRKGVRFATFLVAVFTAWAAAPVHAQVYAEERRSLGIAPDPIARSPRLLGMGRLSYVLDDRQNQISLWDFARNPTGLLDDDTTSTFEIAPTTHAGSRLRDLNDFVPTRERQYLAYREFQFAFEGWHRTTGSNAYGLTGDMGVLRSDAPINQDIESRTSLSEPRIGVVINGHMPYILTERMQYALRAGYAYQESNDRLREIVKNAAGDYIDVEGDIVPPSNLFTPNQHSVRNMGGGAALSYQFGDPLTVAAGFDAFGQLIKGTNEGGRYNSETRENRPYGATQLTAVGHVGKQVEYGFDAQAWKANSEATWVFSISSGPASSPLAGRGNLYDRKEEGSSYKGRLRWLFGAFEVGGGFESFRREVRLFAPPAGDSSSFNHFRNMVYNLPTADTLFIPDSIRDDRVEEKSWEGGGGIGWTRPDRGLIAGVEFHKGSGESTGLLAGNGPKPADWDVRGGVEYALGKAVRARAGYIHRWNDRDELTLENEYLANSATLGLGLSPAGASWTIESGFLYEWEQSDYGDPGRTRTTRHQLGVRVYWPL